MHDLRWIRENPGAFDAGLKRRGLEPIGSQVLARDKKRRDAQTEAQRVQSEHNQLSKEIGAAKATKLDAGPLLARVSDLKARQGALEQAMRKAETELEEFLKPVPNLPAADVPDGADERANLELRRWGEPPKFATPPRQHFELGETLGMMDFEQAGIISGARFTILKGPLARLERALAQFMLDLHTQEHGYTEVSPPLLVRAAAAYGTANLPKFAADLFQTTNGYWLIPTAEVPLTNLVAGRLLDESALPLRFTAWSACFRSEAGAAGKDTRGMLRQHQFYKVELVSIAHPDKSEDEHQRMTACAEEVLKRLGLPYRVVVLSTGDMGFASRKTFDIEVWLPGQNAYREISSCSNCGDFQARRMDARFRPAGQKGTRYVHTLNGSGVAVGRALIAVMENFQRADGSIMIPEALRAYMNGRAAIGADA